MRRSEVIRVAKAMENDLTRSFVRFCKLRDAAADGCPNAQAVVEAIKNEACKDIARKALCDGCKAAMKEALK